MEKNRPFSMFSIFPSASLGEFGDCGGDSCAGQGCGVSEEDLSGTFPCRPGGALCAVGETSGQRGLVHLPNICLRSFQRLLPTRVQHC